MLTLWSAGLDHVTPQKVAAGSTHCICLTGESIFQTDFIFCLVRIETNLHLNFICLQSKVMCSSGAAINMVSWSARVSSCHFLWLWIDLCCRAREWLTFTAAGRTLSQKQASHTSNFTQTIIIALFLVIRFTIYYLFTESGRVFTWGRSNYGQLGQTNQGTEKEPDDSTSSGQTISRPIEVKALLGATQVWYQPYSVVLLFSVLYCTILYCTILLFSGYFTTDNSKWND